VEKKDDSDEFRTDDLPLNDAVIAASIGLTSTILNDMTPEEFRNKFKMEKWNYFVARIQKNHSTNISLFVNSSSSRSLHLAICLFFDINLYYFLILIYIK
jgi:hypothetical protein